MSTFNGEKFIVEQLDSILNQKGVDMKLLIRDDGSTDKTLTIISDYIDRYPDLIILIKGNNIGWRKSFFELAEYAAQNLRDYYYFAFADQDDIWMPDKLSRAVDCIKCHDSGIALYCSNFHYYENGINHGLGRDESLTPSAKKCLIRNLGLGCSEVMNRNLLLAFTKERPKMEMAHDEWAYLVANLCGHMFLDKESRILYRQHSGNQVGIRRSFLQIWKRRLRTLGKSLKTHPKETAAKEMIRIHGNLMTHEAMEAAIKLATYRGSISSMLNLLRDKDYTFDRRNSDFWLKLKILFGIL